VKRPIASPVLCGAAAAVLSGFAAALACGLAALWLAQPVRAQVENPRTPRLGGPLIDGSVTRAHGCGSHFFVIYRDEYALAEWLGGQPPIEGDVLEGIDDQQSLERVGRMTFVDLATRNTMEFVIEKTFLNRADYSKTVRQVCR
jgi:hypothetical protein